MTTLSETLISTTLGESLTLTNIDPRTAIELELLRAQPLKNEEIIELAAYICQAESIDPFIEHIIVLRDRYDMTIEIRPLEIEIISLRDKFTPRSLRNFYIALGDVGYHGLVMKVITLYQQDHSAAVYLQNLETAFGVRPDAQFVKDVLRIINNSDMEGPGINAAIHLFEEKLRQISEYAPIPKYIHDFDIIVNTLPRLQESEITQEMSPEFVAEHIQERLNNMGQYLEVPEDTTAKDILTTMISNMNADQYDELINKLAIDPEEVQRIRGHRDIFRVYGPVNPYPDTDFSSLLDETGEPDVNVIFGGARMFTDLSLEIDDETGVPLDEWFTGHCMQCSLRIRSYHHSVREPGLLGGWNGCFCSWTCVRGSIRDGKSGFDLEGDISDPSRFNLYALQLALTVQIENDMIEIGIADRDYDEDDANEDYDENNEGVGLRSNQINQDVVETLRANIEASFNINPTQPPIPIVQLPFSE